MAKTKECIGQCTKCGTDDITFIGTPNLESQTLYFDYECNNEACGHKGREVYKVTYAYSE